MKFSNINRWQIPRSLNEWPLLSLFIALGVFLSNLNVCYAVTSVGGELDDNAVTSISPKQDHLNYKRFTAKFNSKKTTKLPNEYAIKQEKSPFIEKCHVIPNPDQLIITNFYENENSLNNNTNRRVPRQLPVNNYNNRHQHKRKSGQNFIIHPHYHDSFANLPKDILSLYKENLIPDAINYWETSLKLKYPYFPIYLGRLCATSQVYYSETTKSVSCEKDCAAETKCGDYIVIPEEHLDVCRYCLNGNECHEKEAKSSGVNADFILYISAINTEHCNISNTVAFASYCQLESKHNRYCFLRFVWCT
jgi:hypothetical protein